MYYLKIGLDHLVRRFSCECEMVLKKKKKSLHVCTSRHILFHQPMCQAETERDEEETIIRGKVRKIQETEIERDV